MIEYNKLQALLPEYELRKNILQGHYLIIIHFFKKISLITIFYRF
jgi:hypothetical protein